jgi:hypothetical protein
MPPTTHPATNDPDIPEIRLRQPLPALLDKLGLLKQLPGTWHGTGFNLIARPQFKQISGQSSDFFLEINLTQETLKFDFIGSSIPNRGFAQKDIELFGVHYLQQINDSVTKGALHIEPGIWINIPSTTQPAVPQPNAVARMASIPHGTSLLAQGQAIQVNSGPVFKPANTVPFAAGPISFPEYNLSTPSVFRSPLPPSTVIPLATLQSFVTNPNTALQNAVAGQTIDEMVVINIATAPTITVHGTVPPTVITTPNGGGGSENIAFLSSTTPTPPPPPNPLPNANVPQVFATFWIETVKHPSGVGTFLQLQYSQTVHLFFNGLFWPHVSVATLIRSSIV